MDNNNDASGLDNCGLTPAQAKLSSATMVMMVKELDSWTGQPGDLPRVRNNVWNEIERIWREHQREFGTMPGFFGNLDEWRKHEMKSLHLGIKSYQAVDNPEYKR